MIDFVVVAAPRTGSNHLCALFNSAPGVMMHYEVFHPDSAFFASHGQASAMLSGIPLSERDADPVAFLNRVKQADAHRCVGFKLFPGQAEGLRRELVQAPGIRKIVLHRANVLAVYASNLRAIQENSYHAMDSEARANSLVPFDPHEFITFRADYEAWYARTLALAQQAGEPLFFLPYDQIGNPGVVAAAIHHATGRSPRAKLRSDHVKTGSSDIVSRFENAGEVDAFLTRIGRNGWRYEH